MARRSISTDLWISVSPIVNVILSIVPPGMPIPVTFPKIWRRGVSFESALDIGRVLMVGNGGLSEDVSIQPAERISRMITIEKINERLRAIEKLLFQLAVESLSMVTRKSFGHSVYLLILGPKIILDLQH